MAKPASFPEVDTNGTQQPALPSGLLQGTKDDGFDPAETITNDERNWLFKLTSDWLKYFDTRSDSTISTNDEVEGTDPETIGVGAVVAADVLSESSHTISVKGSWEITNDTGDGTSWKARVRAGQGLFATLVMEKEFIGIVTGDIIHSDFDFVMGPGGFMHYNGRVWVQAASPLILTEQIYAGTIAFDIAQQSRFQLTGEIVGATNNLDSMRSRAHSVTITAL